MSDVDRLRESFAAMNNQEGARFIALYDDDVELYVPSDIFEGPGIHCGRDAVVGWFNDYLGPWWQTIRFEPEFTEVGGRIAAHGTWHAEGARSGVPVRGDFLTVFTFLDGRITHIAHFGTRVVSGAG